jgi:arsenate reductase-like glutaredoxin family protein
LSEAELRDIARRAGGIRVIFAFGSPAFKKLGREPESFSDDDLVGLVLKEPRLLRRPLLVDGERVYVGGRHVGQALL